MLENLHCKCHICKVERHLFKSLTQPPASVRFTAIALSSPALARFSNVSELLTDLHAGRNNDSGASLAGELVPVLLSAGTDVSDIELIQAVLVLAFTPTIHRTHRELCAWFRELESEDIGQQILTLFLELVTSASPTLMNRHLPAIGRAVSREGLEEQAGRDILRIGLLSGERSGIPFALARGPLNLPREENCLPEMSGLQALLYIARSSDRESALHCSGLRTLPRLTAAGSWSVISVCRSGNATTPKETSSSRK